MTANKIDWNNVPAEVWYLAIAKHYGIPVGSDTYNKIYKYPEYFPEECERKRKWDSVPEHVKTMYQDEMSKLWMEEWMPSEPGEGLLARINNPEKLHKWEKECEVKAKIIAQREKEIQDKYLKLYGL